MVTLGAHEVQSFAPACKTLLQFMLTMLPECGDNFLPVFRCVHGFCVGEGFLGPSDEPLLVEQMKLCRSSEGGGESLEKKEEADGDAAMEGGQKCEISSSLSTVFCTYDQCYYQLGPCNMEYGPT